MDLITIQSKKNRKTARSLTLSAFPVVALVTALSGCGGGATNNLPDPSVIVDNTKIVSCTGNTCVTSQFVVDAPVVGLNYQCGTVNDVTDSTGTVVCPDQSVATFSLQGKDSKRSITLGTYLVKSKRDVGRTATKLLVSITPLDLVPSAANADSLADVVATPAVNIAQLLESLRSPASPYSADSPTSRLIIDDATKEKINLLVANVTAADLTSGEFATKVQPILTSLGVTLVSPAETIARFMKALQAIQAGFYFSNPLFISGISDLNVAANIATIAKSDLADDQAVLGLSSVIDRSGRLLGQGAEWNGNVSPPDPSKGTKTAYNLLTGPNGYTRLVPAKSASFINPTSGFVNGNFIWQPKAFKLDASNLWVEETDPTKVTKLGQATFSNGRLLGGTYIVGNQTLWQNVTNSATTVLAPENELAKWTQTNSATSNPYSGTLSFQKSRSVDTFLDPTVFKTAANVGKGNQAIFPLYAILTFTYVDKNKATQLLGQQGIAILANGDIETDMDKNCRAGVATEYPIGLVAAAFQGITNVTDRFISPIIMLSGQQFGQLDGIQMGSLSFSRAAKINVVGATRGSINISDNMNLILASGELVTGEQNMNPATYTHFYDIWSQLKNTNPSVQTDADKAVALRALGKVDIALNTSCYTPPVGL